MILFFDTETTGFPHKSKPVDHPDQPHIVQLAAALTEDDGRVVSSFNFIIDPGVENGVRIPSAAAAIHGIDEERCWRVGIEPRHAFNAFEELHQRADLVVGHNIEFDVEMMIGGFKRWLGPAYEALFGMPRFCTMRQSTDICCIPSPRGGNKWPKLGEAYQHFFGEELTGAHDAMVDLMACKRVYFHLKSIGAA